MFITSILNRLLQRLGTGRRVLLLKEPSKRWSQKQNLGTGMGHHILSSQAFIQLVKANVIVLIIQIMKLKLKSIQDMADVKMLMNTS